MEKFYLCMSRLCFKLAKICNQRGTNLYFERIKKEVIVYGNY